MQILGLYSIQFSLSIRSIRRVFPKHRILNSNWQSQIPNTNQTCLNFQIFLTFFCLLDFVCINLWTPQRLSCLISYSKHVYTRFYHEKLSSQESNSNIYRPRSVHCFQNYFRLSIILHPFILTLSFSEIKLQSFH